jgi:hypothetical protein
MESTQQNQQQKTRIAVVKAWPMPGHVRRWAGEELWVDDPREDPPLRRPSGKHALPWPATEVKVEIVDTPEPFDPLMNGGVAREISPATLHMLEQDPRINVHVLGEGGDPAEQVRMAAALAHKEEKIIEAQRQLAEVAENAAADRQRYESILESSAKSVAEHGAKVTELEAEVAALKAQLAEKKAVKK